MRRTESARGTSGPPLKALSSDRHDARRRLQVQVGVVR